MKRKDSKNKALTSTLAFVAGLSVILIHELGHALALTLRGIPCVLHYNRVSLSTPAPFVDVDLLGPLLPLIIAIVTSVIFLRTGHSLATPIITVFSSLSFLEGFIGVTGMSQDDAYRSSLELGLESWVVPCLFIGLSLILWFPVFKKRRQDFVPSIVFGIVGMLVWYFMLGPAILP